MRVFVYMFALDVHTFCEHKERGLRVMARVLSQVLTHFQFFRAFLDATRAATYRAYNSEF
eukprot:6213456-Pleurochrysis_carterae.AAC.1